MAADNTMALWGTAIVTVIAIVAAPITALWVQRKGDDHRALRKRREEIFRALWTNRARPMHYARVDALNMIDVEFYGERKVIDAWDDLLSIFRSNSQTLGISEAELLRQRTDKYATLLFEIGQLLGYEFGKTHIREDVYRPDIHNEIDNMELETRRLTRNLLKGLDGMDALPVRFVADTKPIESDSHPDK